MNTKAVKQHKHGRTFVDDFWDTWDKVVDKLTCEKYKKKTLSARKKSKDDVIFSEISTTVVCQKITKSTPKSTNKNKKTNNESPEKDVNLVPKFKKPCKNIMKDKLRQQSMLKEQANETRGTMTEESNYETSTQEIIFYNKDNDGGEEETYRGYQEMLRCIAEEQETAGMKKTIKELINHSNEAIREEGEKAKGISTMSYTAQSCPSCESRKNVKLSDSYTQYDEQRLLDRNVFPSKELMYYSNENSYESTTILDDEREPYEGIEYPQDVKSESEWRNIYRNYKEAYKACYEPFLKTQSTWEDIYGYEEKQMMQQKQSPEYYQKQLSKAYRCGTSTKNGSPVRGQALPDRGRSPMRGKSPKRYKSSEKIAGIEKFINHPENARSPQRYISPKIDTGIENLASSEKVMCLPERGRSPQKYISPLRRKSPEKNTRRMENKTDIKSMQTAEKVMKPLEYSSQIAQVNKTILRPISPGWNASSESGRSSGRYLSPDQRMKKFYSPHNSLSPGPESGRSMSPMQGKSPTRFENSEKDRYIFPDETTMDAMQRSFSPCRDHVLNTTPFSNYYCSVAALKGLPGLPGSSDFTTSA